ncbi:MAG: hypothetical protein HOO96_03670 [Polyangiaceae bacterium]|nr:hypothetical protein [Polyangiaceae bacterium]
MSHEMRTPPHGILGVTPMMQDAGAVPAGEQLVLVEQAGEHLLRLINDALDVSKLEGGHLRLTPKPFDLEHLIEDVISPRSRWPMSPGWWSLYLPTEANPRTLQSPGEFSRVAPFSILRYSHLHERAREAAPR